jgi:7,8-dihydropterin-6-yl-methyl-4-(beta-D-ribofuranosyl)aminobenzene 5'-phosphate synthase
VVKKFITEICVVGSAILHTSKVSSQESLMPNKKGRYEIGTCRKVRIKCVSESRWRGSEALGKNRHTEYGGSVSSSQDSDCAYAAGNCALVQIEMLNGATKRFLFDSGGEENNLGKCLRREGIDQLLREGDVKSVVVSHEHRDNSWGLRAILDYNPEIRIYIPDTFDPKKFYCLMSNEFVEALGVNWVEHEGTLIKLKTGEIVKLCEGCVAITFECVSYGQVHSETSLCCQVNDTGLVLITGCCHQGVKRLADFVKQNIEGGEKIYGFYGGLHIAPLERISPGGKAEIERFAEYGFSKIACNHCTGKVAVEKMLEMHYPVVKGMARYGSESNLYMANGDEVFFG